LRRRKAASAPAAASSDRRIVEGSGTAEVPPAGRPPDEVTLVLPPNDDDEELPSSAKLLALGEPVERGVVTEPPSTRALLVATPRGLPLASEESMITVADELFVPPITSAPWMM
jgi:hypothetical protein